MKKILASILCAALLLTTMSFSAFAEGSAPAARSLEAVASEETVYEGDIFEVNIVINGDKIANSEWTLTYDNTLVELTGINTYPMTYGHGSASDDDGIIKDYHYLTEKDEVYPNGANIKSYRFKTLPQSNDDVVCNFTLSSTSAYTWIESIDGIDVVAGSISDSVTIKHREFTTTVKFDDEIQTEASISFPYDNDNHSFEVSASETDYVEEIIYKVEGVEKTLTELEEMLKDTGSYVIEYTVVAKDGYADKTGTFTVNIGDSEYVVEVDTAAGEGHDYVDGKKLVLVYTATPNTYFEYDGEVMIDVSNSTYKYNDTVEYYYVYAFVTDAIDGGELADYKDGRITVCYGTDVAPKIEEYNTDINCTGGSADIRDVTSIYGIYNVNTEYYADSTRMLNILKGDIDNSKFVDGVDLSEVTNEAFPVN